MCEAIHRNCVRKCSLWACESEKGEKTTKIDQKLQKYDRMRFCGRTSKTSNSISGATTQFRNEKNLLNTIWSPAVELLPNNHDREIDRAKTLQPSQCSQSIHLPTFAVRLVFESFDHSLDSNILQLISKPIINYDYHY